MDQIVMDGLTAGAGLQPGPVLERLAGADAACCIQPGFGVRIHGRVAAVEAHTQQQPLLFSEAGHPAGFFQIIGQRLVHIYRYSMI
ncbi:hypothetical protein D3C75_1217140 [compost metagenome]